MNERNDLDAVAVGRRESSVQCAPLVSWIVEFTGRERSFHSNRPPFHPQQGSESLSVASSGKIDFPECQGSAVIPFSRAAWAGLGVASNAMRDAVANKRPTITDGHRIRSGSRGALAAVRSRERVEPRQRHLQPIEGRMCPTVSSGESVDAASPPAMRWAAARRSLSITSGSPY